MTRTWTLFWVLVLLGLAHLAAGAVLLRIHADESAMWAFVAGTALFGMAALKIPDPRR